MIRPTLRLRGGVSRGPARRGAPRRSRAAAAAGPAGNAAPAPAAAGTFPGSKPKTQRKAVPVETEDAQPKHSSKKTVAIILGSLVVVALIALILIMSLQGGKSGVDSVTLDHETAEIAPQDTLTLTATVLDAKRSGTQG